MLAWCLKMDGFLIRYPKISDATRLVDHTRQYQSDDAEKMGKHHHLSIHFEGLERLRILKGLRYRIREYQSDDAEKMGKPHHLSIRFEGLERL